MDKTEAQNKLNELKLKAEELQAIIDKPDFTPWEPKGANWSIRLVDHVLHHYTTNTRMAGLERETKEVAEGASTLILRHSRLLAYRDEFDTPNYSGHGFVVSEINGIFRYDCIENGSLTDVMFKSQKNAYELCLKLKSGEVVL